MSIRAATIVDAPALAQVQVRAWRQSYRGLIDEAHLAGLAVAARTTRWLGNLADVHSTTYVALVDGQVVGFASVGPDRGHGGAVRGELYAIYLLDEAKRRGLGRQLFERARGWLDRFLLHPFRVWVLTANAPARRFYEACGGELGPPATTEIGGATHPTVSYGWS